MTIDDERPEDERTEAAIANVMTVALAIAEHSKGKPGVGRLPCPVCKTGTLGYSVAGRSRSLAARCSTAGCVAFMS